MSDYSERHKNKYIEDIAETTHSDLQAHTLNDIAATLFLEEE